MSSHPCPRLNARTLAGFVILFGAYQLPQGIMILTGSLPLFLAATLSFLPIAYAVASMTGDRGWGEYYLALTPRAPLLLAVGLPLGLTAAAFGNGVGLRFHSYRIDAVAPVEPHIARLLLTYAVSFISSVAEDIVTRGYLLRHWPLHSRSLFAPISAGVYVLNHIYALAAGPSLWAFLFLLGIALAVPLARTDQMWLTVGAHWGWNVVYHTINLLLLTTAVDPLRARWCMSAGSVALIVLLVLAVYAVPSRIFEAA